MKGRALIDLPEHKLKCGDYGEIADRLAKPLVKAGHFDPKAELQGEETADQDDDKDPDDAGSQDSNYAGSSDDGANGDDAAQSEVVVGDAASEQVQKTLQEPADNTEDPLFS